jgi:heat shock protein HslJ
MEQNGFEVRPWIGVQKQNPMHKENKVKLERLYALTLVALLFTSLIAGCAPIANASDMSGDRDDNQEIVDLSGTSWTLFQIGGQFPVSDSNVTIIFDKDQAHGNATCNTYSVSYESTGTDLSFGLARTTMMACPHLDQETSYLAALASVTGYRVENDQLVLSSPDADALLVFVPTQHAPLAGTTWQLTGLNTGTAIASVLRDTKVTATFVSDQVTGSAGCNNYFGSFATDGDQISIGPVANTEMYCSQPEGLMEQEQAYLRALASANSLEIEGQALTIRNAAGERMLEFVATDSE